ncbi:MAG: NUDIX domain-containing protein [Ardenticatenaceae bacterium]|nr:NUDIX domain-containing protein [Anaerolineales bacterium]MCB8920032.1 NUDIX domain-containing protein [Ardenticatenaceae bacterium]MCB8989877.1 NUDIX domain-containing protein [Ardenticatenaceae bacterium]MCB9005650.1 NUDIX domain-containing protein [Ardenticatenaceae bacterium]
MTAVLDKVTAFITRQQRGHTELLLLRHPFAGNQIPAGTVEPGEALETAVLREATEETGLTQLSPPIRLGQHEETLPPKQRVILTTAPVYARPDTSSFHWATLRRGITVAAQRQADGFTQVEYIEHDQLPDPHFITYRILGWVPDETVTAVRRRTFFHLTCTHPTPASWQTTSDNHTFTLFWAALDDLPPIIPPQNKWLQFLSET